MNDDGSCNIEYDDGDEEEDVQPEFIKLLTNEDESEEEEEEAPEAPAAKPGRGGRVRKEVDYSAADSKLDEMEFSGDDDAPAPQKAKPAKKAPAKAAPNKRVADSDDSASAASEVRRARALPTPGCGHGVGTG